MCDGKHECRRPKELIGKPEECSPEQIKKCHGEDEGHPCIENPGTARLTDYEPSK